jgi:hypothetical protein
MHPQRGLAKMPSPVMGTFAELVRAFEADRFAPDFINGVFSKPC